MTHVGVERMLHRDLVRAGALDADVARLFGRLQKTRIDADYTSEIVFTEAGAADDVDAAAGSSPPLASCSFEAAGAESTAQLGRHSPQRTSD